MSEPTTQAMLDHAEPESTDAAAEAVLSPMDRVKLARDPQRPHTLDYIRELFSNFIGASPQAISVDRAVSKSMPSPLKAAVEPKVLQP